MKKSTPLFYLSLIFVFILSACSMEKRVYRSGYHIQWQKNKFKTDRSDEAKLEKNNSNLQNDIEGSEEVLVLAHSKAMTKQHSSADEFIISLQEKAVKQKKKQLRTPKLPPHFIPDEPCDIITLKSGAILEGKVLEIGTSIVKYKKCDNLDGPIISIRKSTVQSIQYPNGSIDELVKTPSAPLIPEGESGDRSVTVAILLWAFLGIIGIHRFYLGHIGMGILYLLTAGLCGIGWCIDIILLLTGDLQPKNGKYVDRI